MRFKSLIAIIACLITVSAVAATVFTVNWIFPIVNTDGTSIPANGEGSLLSTRIEYGICNPDRTQIAVKSGDLTVSVPSTSTSLPGLPPGTWCARAFSRNTYGNESDASNVASKVVAAPTTPSPPTNFSID